jgi:CheY-like chemotaxis protein
VERHALNTVFRLSEQRDTVYSLWLEGAPQLPKLALVDGQSDDAPVQLALPHDPELKLIWVGAVAPARVSRIFERPLSWPDLLSTMDQLFASTGSIDFDLDLDAGGPETIPGGSEEPVRRVLIASANREERLYLRAKLALAELTHADEAETGAQALELARTHRYTVALVDFGLPDVSGWALLRQLRNAPPAIPHVIVTKDKASPGERVRAWFGGAEGCFDKPLHPGKLQLLLDKV